MESSRERDVEQAAVGTAPEPAESSAAPVLAGPLTAAKITALQRFAGNAAVARLLEGSRPPAPPPPTAAGPSILTEIENAGPPDASGEARRAESPATDDSTKPAAGASSADAASDQAASAAAAPASAATAPGPAAEHAGPAGADAAAPGPAGNGLAAAAGAAAVPAGGPAGAAGAGPAAAAGTGVAGPAAAAGAAGAGPAAPVATVGVAAGAQGAAAGAPGAASSVTPAAAAAGATAGPTIVKDPHADPGFQAMKGRSKSAAGGAKGHAPAKAGAAAAQAAAAPPSNDLSSQAQAAQVDEMASKQPGTFDRAAFVAAVSEAIEKAAPKNLDEADDFKADGVKEQISGQVKEGKEGSQKDIKDATDAPPDTSKAKPKPVEPLRDEPVGQAPAAVGAASAMPPPAPAAATDLSAGPESVDAKLAEAEVTDEQIQKSNEPEFKSALDARDQAKEHAATAPAGYREDEQGILGKAKGDATGLEAQGLQQMHGARGQAFAQAVGHKQGAKSADEAKRTKVATDIQGIYDRTKADVTKTLDGLDGKVDAAFTQGEGQARKRFEDHVGAQMDAYKEERYSGLLGKGRWLKDKLAGMPSEVNRFYAEGKTRYLADMDGVIGRIADIVGAGLNAARARIAQGKAEITKYVAQLPKDLKLLGKEAEDKLSSQFEQLESDVDAKQSEMVDTLARKYVESRDALDARIDEMKAANRGLVDKAIDAVVGVVKTILQLKTMLLGVLAKAADVIGLILQDPIGFLGNLIRGITAGLTQFVGNIATHLQQGLMGWLTGALGNAGIELPKTFDLKGIFGLVMQLLGLTYRTIRARVVKLVGEKVMGRLEQSVDIFKVLMSEGVGGLWRFVSDRLGDLEETVLGGIKTFIIEKVIKAGITWLIAFMNPAAAFIKACKAIYDIVMFIVERGSEIMSFVSSILDSVGAIATGSIGVVVEKVEQSLAKALPLAISFLASLLGLGGISDKIRSIIQKVKAPIDKAIDFVVMGAVKGAKKLFGWAKGKAKSVKDRFTGKGKQPQDAQPPPDDDREARLKAATDEVEAAMRPKEATVEGVRAQLPEIKARHKLTDLTLEKQDEFSYRPKAVINPTLQGDVGVLFTPEQLAEMNKVAQQWAKQIKEKKQQAEFLADPMKFITGGEGGRTKVQVGDAVEAAAGPELDVVATEAGLTLVRGLHLQARGGKGPIGGKQAEMDFVMLGPSAVVEIVSAKLDPGAYRFGKDRKAIGHFNNAPLSGPDLVAYLKAHFGGSPAYEHATGLEAVSSAGRMPLGDFRAQYLDKVPVDSIKVSGVSPGPEQPLNRQLRSTAPQLLDEMIKMVTALL